MSILIRFLPYHLLSAFLIAVLVAGCSSSEPAANGAEETPRPSAAGVHSDVLTEVEAAARKDFIRGITAKELEDYEKAEEHLTRAQSILYQSPGVNHALAGLYYKMDDYVNGLYYARRAVDQEPENKWYRLKLVDGYRSQGNHEDVIQQLDSILVYHPSDLDVLYIKAQVQSVKGDYEGSNKTYQRILDLTGPDRSIYYQRISNFTRLEDTGGIIDELNKVLETNQGNMNTLMMLSQLYLEEDKLDEARVTLEKALDRNPRHPEALINLADIYIRQEKWDRAGELLGGLIRDNDVDTSDKLEIVQYVISRYASDPENDALKDTTEDLVAALLESESENGMIHAMAAEFFNLADEPGEAIHHLRETTRLLPENDAAWRQLVQTYYIDGDYQAAISTGKEADEFVPDDPFILFFVGGSYFLEEEKEEAADWLKKASGMPARSEFRSIILGTLGDVYASLENWDRADEAYEEAISLDSDNDTALNNYAYYLSERGKRLQQAKEMATRALELNPDNAAFLDTMGWVYYKLGDYEKAHEYIRASIDTGEASAEVLEHMGDVYDKLGEPDRAHYWWQKALEEDESRDYLHERLP
ncbi:tetratricopeptide repeat protein [Natronogracilivirga saccharolytica]|uniref:Tetratricopeptide repeat protein n=1 Tax=Natronogracilivirga saccharolytica TaxID=2812953 RepID=A0A8J7RS38_9BACT|nr:tetratricopeptide repeat protein [Natronogracilivirga saccharolytica]MBP3192749.1 tetratricopeptide repeat protein [Natronogracilivirga saccharolytica]